MSETQTEVLIIGTGLAGSIAYQALRAFKPICLDARPEPENGQLGLHPAVMRLRDRQVADTIGAKFKKISISKAIYMEGLLHTKANILFNNLYSKKVYGALGRRSLNNLEDETRYIMPDGYPAPRRTIWGHKVVNIKEPGEVTLEGDEYNYIRCRYIVSTVPMPTMATYIAGSPPDFREDFSYTPVKVLTIKLNIPSTINQTIYFPSPKTDIYRITIQGQYAIIESTEETGDWAVLIQTAFGIDSSCFDYGATRMNDWKTIPFGKISPIDEDSRLRYIMWLTDAMRVFSFGRFAVWKPLRTDHLLGDIEKIRRIISASDIEGRYKGRL